MPILKLAPQPGLEPGTHGLTVRRSTIELLRNNYLLFILETSDRSLAYQLK